jgi:hypothetical protein
MSRCDVGHPGVRVCSLPVIRQRIPERE